jgi:hypothetical protein
MKTLELMKILKEYPLFTENDVAKIISKNPKYSVFDNKSPQLYTKTLLHRLKKRN